MSDTRRHMIVQPTLQDVARATEALHHALPRRLGEHDRYGVELALAEVLTNIVEHGLRGVQPAPIELTWVESDSALQVEVRDSGRAIPADRLEDAGPDTFAFDRDDLDALPEGGLGLAILKTVFDVVDYRSDADGNCMRLEKRFA